MTLENEIINAVIELDREQLKAFYTALKVEGFTEEEIRTIQTQAAITRLLTDEDYYNKVVKEMGEQIYNEFND